MDQLGADFDARGNVMTPAQLQEYRLKRGECVTCGRKCFEKKKFLRKTPITEHGLVLNGRCLKCNPLDSGDASKQAQGGVIPAVSRPATREDLARFTRSLSNLALGSAAAASGAAPASASSSSPSQGVTRGQSSSRALRASVSSPLPAAGPANGSSVSNNNNSTMPQRRTSTSRTQSSSNISDSSQPLVQPQRQASMRALSTHSETPSNALPSPDQSPASHQMPGHIPNGEPRRMSLNRPQKQPAHGNSSIRSLSRDSLNSNDESVASLHESIASHQRGSYVIDEEASLHQDFSDRQDNDGDFVSPRTAVDPRRASLIDIANGDPHSLVLSPSAHMIMNRNGGYPYYGSDQDEGSFVDEDANGNASVDSGGQLHPLHHHRELMRSYHSVGSRGSRDSRNSRGRGHHPHSPGHRGSSLGHLDRRYHDDDESFTNTSENYDDYAPLPDFHTADIVAPTGEEIEDAYDRMTAQPSYGHHSPTALDHYHVNGGPDAILGGPYDTPLSLDRLQSERSLGSSQTSAHNSSNNNSMNMRALELSQRSLRSDRSGHNTEEEIAAYESRQQKHGILNRGGTVNLVNMTGGCMHGEGFNSTNASNSVQSSSSERNISSHHDQLSMPYNSGHGTVRSAGKNHLSSRSLEASVSSFEEDILTVERQESMNSFRSQGRGSRSNSWKGDNGASASELLGSSSTHSHGHGGRYVIPSSGASYHSCDYSNDNVINVSGHSTSNPGRPEGGLDLYLDRNANSTSTATTYLTAGHGSRQNSQTSGLSRTEEGLERLSRVGTDFIQLIDIMHDFPNSEPVLSSCMQEISNMRLSPEDCDALAEAGGLDAILEAMRFFPEEAELHLCGCRALCDVSGTQGNQLALVDGGAAELLLENTMETFADIPELQEQAMAALANLAALDANLEHLLSKEIVVRVVQSMNRHSKNAQVQMKGCWVITNLASHPTEMKSMVMMAGGGGAVVLAMVLHAKDAQLQEKGLQALRNLSAHCEENKVELAHIGGIHASIDAMKLHRDDPYVQEAGAWTLCNLAGNMNNRKQIGEAGGIDVVVRAMWVHSDQVSVGEWCVRALFSLSLYPANCRSILEVNGITAVISAMQGHEKSSFVQEMGCAILSNLAKEEQAKTRIVNEEALDAIVLAMVLYGEDARVQEQACQVLLRLAIAPNVTPMHASNVVELVKVAAGRFPENCGEAAEEFISMLTEITPGYIEGQGSIPVS